MMSREQALGSSRQSTSTC